MKKRALTIAVVAISAAMASARARAEEEPQRFNTRAIIRTGIDRDGRVHGPLAQLTGLKRATAVAYKIMILEEDGTERVVEDETKERFQVGQQFRLIIEADTDLFLYVFHEGADGQRTRLVPDDLDDGPPQVRRDQRKVIPHDGTYFEFVPPTGVDKLLVYASPEERPELTPDEAFDEKKDAIRLKSVQDATFKTARTEGPAKAVTTPDPKKVAEQNGKLPEWTLRGLRWEPETNDPASGRVIVAGSYDAEKSPVIFKELELRTK